MMNYLKKLSQKVDTDTIQHYLSAALGLFLVLLAGALMWWKDAQQPSSTMPASGSLLVTQEIRYHVPGAGEVFLVWGVNGWGTVSDQWRPARTVVKNKVMHTPMSREGDVFVATLQVSVGTTINYGFLVTADRSGAAINALWHGGQSLIAIVDSKIEVESTLTLPEEQSAVSSGASVQRE